VDGRERRAADPGPAEEVQPADGRPGVHDRGDVREAHGRGQESREREAQADSAQGRPRRVRVHRRLRRAGARRDAGRVRAEVTTRVCNRTGCYRYVLFRALFNDAPTFINSREA